MTYISVTYFEAVILCIAVSVLSTTCLTYEEICLVLCFSTGVLQNLRVQQNLRVPPMASRGSTESYREMGTKRHLRPVDAFSDPNSGPLVHPKRSGLCSELRWSYSTPPDPLACCVLSKNLFSALGLKFHDFPLDKFLAICP